MFYKCHATSFHTLYRIFHYCALQHSCQFLVVTTFSAHGGRKMFLSSHLKLTLLRLKPETEIITDWYAASWHRWTGCEREGGEVGLRRDWRKGRSSRDDDSQTLADSIGKTRESSLTTKDLIHRMLVVDSTAYRRNRFVVTAGLSTLIIYRRQTMMPHPCTQRSQYSHQIDNPMSIHTQMSGEYELLENNQIITLSFISHTLL